MRLVTGRPDREGGWCPGNGCEHEFGFDCVPVAFRQCGLFEPPDSTTHTNPTFFVNHVLHLYVTNILGELPRSRTQGLTDVTTPYGVADANTGWEMALTENPVLAHGANVINGKIVQPSVANAFGKEPVTLAQAIGGIHSA